MPLASNIFAQSMQCWTLTEFLWSLQCYALRPAVSPSHATSCPTPHTSLVSKVGSDTIPAKSSIPVDVSRIRNKNGRSTMTSLGGDGMTIAALVIITPAVTAAAFEPSSSTSTTTLWKTDERCTSLSSDICKNSPVPLNASTMLKADFNSGFKSCTPNSTLKRGSWSLTCVGHKPPSFSVNSAVPAGASSCDTKRASAPSVLDGKIIVAAIRPLDVPYGNSTIC